MSTFKELPISEKIQAIIEQLGFHTPTEIQKKSIPLLINAPMIDFHGQAQTGTGKTLAFGIPLIQRLDLSKRHPQALIVAPTRELAVQTYESLLPFARPLGISIEVIYGGVSMEQQMSRLRSGVHIVVGTPGRLNDHMRRKTLQIDKIRTLVLDEADIMLEMGFKEEVDEILKHAPKEREIWLFSATVKQGITDIMRKHMKDPVSVRVSKQQVGNALTKQFYCIVPFRLRLNVIARFIETVPHFYGFIFCQTKVLAGEAADLLVKRGYNVAALHGDMSQQHRNNVIRKFKHKEISIVVATDVAARGIDVADLSHVINYSLPEDLDSYVHRIGRTGRAGKEGTAITLINKGELRSMKYLEQRYSVAINPINIPSAEEIIVSKMQEASEYITEMANKSLPAESAPIGELLKNYSPEQLRTLVTQVVFDKFIRVLHLEDDTQFKETAQQEHRDGRDNGEDLQEIFISVGSDDGITIDDVRKFLIDSDVINPDTIRTIRVIKRRSFVKLSGECSPDLVKALRGKMIKGIPVHVQLTCVVGQQDGGQRSERAPFRPRQRNSFQRRDQRNRRRY